MDNGAFHKHRRTREAIEAAGRSLIYLLPYSPDLNPIEKFWANLKGTLSHILHLSFLSSTSFSMLFWNKMTIVYADESGIDRHLHRRNVRSARGKKVIGFVAGKKFQRTNIVAGYADGNVRVQKGRHSLRG